MLLITTTYWSGAKKLKLNDRLEGDSLRCGLHEFNLLGEECTERRREGGVLATTAWTLSAAGAGRLVKLPCVIMVSVFLRN